MQYNEEETVQTMTHSCQKEIEPDSIQVTISLQEI